MNTATLITGLFVAGFSRDDLSLIAPAPASPSDRQLQVGESAAIGAGVGGALGALLAGFGGLGALVIGGAPVLAAGPIHAGAQLRPRAGGLPA